MLSSDFDILPDGPLLGEMRGGVNSFLALEWL